MKTFLSVDLGAGSGRVIAVNFDGGKLSSEVINRFDNSPFEYNGHIYWNIPALLAGVRQGLQQAAEKYKNIACVGVDTLGLGLRPLDKSGRILGMPYCVPR